MAISFGQPSNYQEIAARGQQILMELMRARQQADQQKNGQLLSLIQNAGQQANQNMTNFAQMRLGQQERAANRQTELERERIRQEGYTARQGQELRAQQDMVRKKALEKLGYIDQPDVSAEDQAYGDYDLYRAQNPNGSFADFAASRAMKIDTLQKMNEQSIKLTGEDLQSSMQRAQQHGLSLGDYYKIRSGNDQYRGWGLSDSQKAEAQRLHNALRSIEDDPAFQDQEGQSLANELRGKINTLFQEGPYLREKETTITDFFNPQAMPQGIGFRQIGKNSGIVTYPDGSGAVLTLKKNRSTGEMELDESSNWSSPKPERAKEAMDVLGLPAEDRSKLFLDWLSKNIQAQALPPQEQVKLFFNTFGAMDNVVNTERSLREAASVLSKMGPSPAAPAANMARPQQIVTTQPAPESLDQVESQLGAMLDRYPNVASMPDNERAKYEDLKRRYVSLRGAR